MEKHYYSKGGTKLIVSASEKEQKKRIRWTEDLHKKFIECVDRLGGAKSKQNMYLYRDTNKFDELNKYLIFFGMALNAEATPKGILKLMECDGLTIFHIKSHLQVEEKLYP